MPIQPLEIMQLTLLIHGSRRQQVLEHISDMFVFQEVSCRKLLFMNVEWCVISTHQLFSLKI